MARSRGPQNLVARDRGRSTDARARDDYDGMIASDLGGRRATSYRSVDDGRPASAAELLLRPLTLFLIACLMLSATVIVWAWQSGRIAAVFAKPHEPPKPSPVRWMVGRPDRGQTVVDPRGHVDGGATPPAPAAHDDDSAATDNTSN